MEAKDYYSLREIVFGLRDEYLKHNEKIEELKRLCTVDEEKVADFNISTIKHHDLGIEDSYAILTCCYEEKVNRIQKLLRDIYARVLNYPNNGKKNVRIVSHDNTFQFNGHGVDLPIGINGKKNNEEFFEVATAMLESPFVNNIDMHSWYNDYMANAQGILLPKNMPGKFMMSSIDAYSSGVGIKMNMRDGNLRKFSLIYNSPSDSLEILAIGGTDKNRYKSYNIDEEAIGEILDIEYPASRLRQYHIDTIEACDKLDKEIVMECTGAKEQVRLNIQENEKQYVLRKPIGD